MDCRVERIEVSKSAALGAALCAAHGWFAQAGKNRSGGKSSPALPIPFRTAKSVQTRRPRGFTTSYPEYAACEREMLAELGCGN